MPTETDTRSWWSVVRYVDDLVREEFRNVGVVVIRPHPNLGLARFLLPDELPSERYALLTTAMSELGFDLRNKTSRHFEVTSSNGELSGLFRVARKNTNHVLFRQPYPAPNHQPLELLEEEFKRFVVPKS